MYKTVWGVKEFNDTFKLSLYTSSCFTYSLRSVGWFTLSKHMLGFKMYKQAAKLGFFITGPGGKYISTTHWPDIDFTCQNYLYS